MSFRICDVFLPESGDLLEQLTEQNVLLGRLIDFSDCGSAGDVFAVVNLREGQTVVVAVDKLREAEGGEETR